MASIEIRPLAEHERSAAADTIRAALLVQPASDELNERRASSWEKCDSVAAWDGDVCVGHVGAFRFLTTVPGGARLPTAGYTRVGVLPTYTRRGLLRQMMERTLREAHERGQVLASLRASEAVIYGRFGFGLGGDTVIATVTTATAKPLRAAPAGGSVRLVGREELRAVVPPLYDRCAARGVGMVDRADWVWDIEFEDVAKPSSEPAARGRFVAVHADEHGVDDAYVHYETGWDDSFGELPHASGRVRDLFATSPAAERAMWEYVLDIDLVGSWKVMRPSDDPIRRAMADPRAYVAGIKWDEGWLRLVDVDRALASRSYRDAHGSVVIEVSDPLFDHNNDRWEVSSAGAKRTDRAAEVTADINTISAAYLGAVPWSDLVASGEVEEPVDADVVATLDTLFTWRPIAFCGTDF